MYSLLVVLAVAASAAARVPVMEVTADRCTVDFGNSTFNLLPLKKAGGYVVQDSRNNQNSEDFTYNFNICDNIAHQLDTACDTTEGSGKNHEQTTGPSPAYQMFDEGTTHQCHRLAGDIETHPPVWSLYNPQNPSVGVSLTYTGGDSCANGRDRSLTLHILCYDDAENIPDKELVYETNECQYEIYLRSSWGCPTECPVTTAGQSGSPKLCSDHGLCDFDTAIESARCFCNEGFDGDQCTAAEKTGGLDAVGVVLVVTSLVLAFLLALLVFLWSKISSLRLDPSAYRGLAAGPDDVLPSGDGATAEPDIYDD